MATGVPEILRPGTPGKIFGLKSASHLNGQSGEVCSFDAEAGRYHVKLNNGEVKAVRPGNFEPDAPEDPWDSPRAASAGMGCCFGRFSRRSGAKAQVKVQAVSQVSVHATNMAGEEIAALTIASNSRILALRQALFDVMHDDILSHVCQLQLLCNDQIIFDEETVGSLQGHPCEQVALKVVVVPPPSQAFCPLSDGHIWGADDHCVKCGWEDRRRRMRVIQGRPYTTKESCELVAPVQWSHKITDGESWGQTTREQVVSGDHLTPDGWTPDVAAEASDEWIRHGQAEHASIASFSRFSFDLLHVAAPPGLVAAAHRAAADEVRHAVLAFGLATHFSKRAVDVKPFPVKTVELCPSIDALAAQVLEEGCVNESIAVAGLAYARRTLSPGSPATQVLTQLFDDEARHAALAWATVQWTAKRGATVPSINTISKPASARNERSRAPSLLTWAGLVPNEIEEEIAYVAKCQWIAPWCLAVPCGGGRMPTVTPATGLVGDAVAEAALHVRVALEAGFDGV